MAVNSVLSPYPAFHDADGSPLEGGYIYIGQPGFEARSNPKASFFDIAQTIPTGTASGAAIRTSGGFPVRNGAPAMFYADADFSISVTDRNGVLLYSALNNTLAVNVGASVGPVLGADGNLGAVGIGFSNESATGWVRSAPGTVQEVVTGAVVSTRTATGVTFAQPVTFSGTTSFTGTASGAGFATGVRAVTNHIVIAQGTLSGAELVVEIPSDIEAVQIDFWNYQPTVATNSLQAQVGSGTIGAPVWIATYQVNTILVTAGTVTGADGTPTFINLAPSPPSSGITASGTCLLQPFNNASIAMTGWAMRNGINTTPANAFSTIGIRATGVVAAMSLIRLFVASGNMAGSYRITGYRKP